MDLATLILVICVVIFAFRGFRSGLIKACGRILALIGGYGASLFYAVTLGEQLSQDLQMSQVAGVLLAALVLFFGAALLINLMVALLLKLLPQSIPDSFPMKLGGAGVGAAAGVVIAVALMWFLSLLKGAADIEVPSSGPLAQLNDLSQQYIQPDNPKSLGNKVLGGTTQLVSQQVAAQMDSEDMIGKAVATLMTQPGETIASLKRLSQSQELQSLLNSHENQQALMAGDTQAIIDLPDFKTLINNQDMRRVFDPTDASDEELANTFATLWQRSQAMQRDPEIQAILQDPDLRQQLESNNPVALLSNPKSMKLIRALLSSPEEVPDPFLDDNAGLDANTQAAHDFDQVFDPGAPNAPDTQSHSPKAKPASTSYVRWVDDDGKVHFGDKLPE